MNENQLSCDDMSLEILIQRDTPLEPSEGLLAHLENCSQCQLRISELAGPTAMWQGVKAAISKDADFDQRLRIPTPDIELT